ncbi:InlB B-repeat-containing protein [Hungatella effluvii]|uniref:InlB B-repeat-containing protein n=1 Tax=Hungatella effluvii TaxID=1096246 RepID=UPI001F570117|nr:InlB B-repeat-containing protein [Hungatella effluvii]
MQSNRKGRRRLCSIVLTAAMVFAALPMTAFTANAETALNCRHEHDDSCYEEDPTATGSDSKKLVCRHEHDESCFEEVIFDGGTSVASPSELFNMRPKTMTGAEELAARINSWADGNGIEARADGDKVIVTGQAVSDKSLRLAIPENVTVEWKAVLESSARYVVHILDTADPNAEFHMAGGAITSLSTEDESAAIYNGDDDTDIVVSGGSITAGDNGKDKPASYGIRNNTDNRITVSGGVISGGDGSGSYGLSNTLGTIIIKGGTVTGGPGINSGIHCENGRIEISGGTVSGGSGDDSFGIYNLDSSVIISGGKVINSGGYAIASIFIQNADKAVIRIDGSSLIFGQDPAELGSTIGQTTNSSVIPTVGGNAAVITWTGSKAEYVNGTAEDLIVSPETVTAKWSQQGGKDGIAYEAGGANKGFIEVPGVTVGTEVKRLAAIAVTNGPVKTVYTEGESFDSTGMTVTANYSDGSKKPVTGYTVTPSGALTVNDSSVTVTYTEGGITKTAVQKITVKAAAVYYKITFHANGGSVTPATGTTGKDGKLKSLPIPTRSGNYRFDGWFSEENGGTQITTDTVFKEDSTIYAHWSDTGGIVLDSIAVTTGPAKTVYTEGESFDSTGMTVTANYKDGSKIPVTGYTVTPSGALTVNDSSVTVTYTEGGITRTAVQKITVKATAVYYKIIFHANGGSVTPAAGTTGKDGKLKSLPIPTRSGNYRFDGWFSEENGGTQVTTDTVFKKDSTIYAHWSDTGGIVLDSIAVTTGPAKTIYTEGESFDSTGMTVTANYKDGSKIPVTGYTVTPSGALTVNDSSVTVTYTEGGITRTAVLEITVKAVAVYYKITFQANGGSVTPAAGTTGKDGKLKSLPIPTRSGNYRFDGWFSEENGGTQVTTDTVFKEDSTIYAHWTYTGGTGGSGGGTGGTGGTGGGTGGSGGGTGGSKGSVSASDRLKESLPPDYTGETQIINNVRVPSYVEEVSWIAMEDGRWRIGRADGSYYVNTWVAAYNPYADLSAKQSAFDWFFADMDGYMDTGWYTDSSGSTYYLNPLSDNTMGRMMTGWVLIDGKHYYFNEKADGTRGKLCRNTFTPDGYYVDEHGVWVQQ